jgi:2,3-bisphosphoglycerate-independent phosphoglycerate mutase
MEYLKFTQRGAARNMSDTSNVKRAVLIIRDGMGVAPPGPGNAVSAASTPRADALKAACPMALLDASGPAVGLPEGYQGSSEVGHLNMGAGRIVKQEITRINEAFLDGSFYAKPAFRRAMENAARPGAALHVMGLVQDEGVHAHQDHLFAIIAHAADVGVTDIHVHFFADGRDTPPRSSLGFLKTLNAKLAEVGVGRVSTVMGRYYAMDRSRTWRLTDTAFAALTLAEGRPAATAQDAIREAYATLKAPDGSEMTDEYIPPSIIGGFTGIRDGDSVVLFNYRQDRAIQLTRAFVEDEYAGHRAKRPEVVYCGLTRYYDSFAFNVLDALGKGPGMANILPEVVSLAGIRQVRVAETQKFSHVTSFMNGKRIEPFPGEDRVEIKSTLDPSLFADHPQMAAYEVADATVEKIRSGGYGLVIVNFANCDMVGHTGNFASAQRAVEVVDECVGRAVDAARAGGYSVMITADHGNAEEMLDADGEPKTAHSTSPVEFICVTDEGLNLKLRDRGILADIAPTTLDLLGLPIPVDMSATSLIVR